MLKSDYFRIEICITWDSPVTPTLLKSDYFRIEIRTEKDVHVSVSRLKSDYFRIEICVVLFCVCLVFG